MKENTALIIIDVQEAMFSDIQNPLYRGDEFLGKILALIQKARDFCIPVIFIQHTEKDDEPMGEGKPGWKIHYRIVPEKNDTVIMKYTPDAFHNTNLHEVLSSRKINKIVVAGLQTECCIDTTCRRAFSLGYETVLVEDGHSTYDSTTLTASQIIEHHNRILGGWFAKVIPFDEITLE